MTRSQEFEQTIFTLEELRRHVRTELADGEVLVHELDLSEPARDAVEDLVAALLRRGCTDLWESLRRARPRRLQDIEGVRRLPGGTRLPDAPLSAGDVGPEV